MALLCKKINQIGKFMNEKLIQQISTVQDKNLLNFSKDLNSTLRIFLNLSDINSKEMRMITLKENFLQKLMNDIKIKDNFGNCGYYDSLLGKIK